MKGLIVNIYKNGDGYDCSNNGVSNRHSKAVLVGDGIPELFDNGTLPILKLVKGYGKNTVVAKPIDCNGRSMFGGAFIYTNDSRFVSAVEAIAEQKFYGAVPLHDRYE